MQNLKLDYTKPQLDTKAVPIVSKRYKTANMKLGLILCLGAKYPNAAETHGFELPYCKIGSLQNSHRHHAAGSHNPQAWFLF